MSTIQMNRWTFPKNTAEHHKANAKDRTQNGAQTRKPESLGAWATNTAGERKPQHAKETSANSSLRT